jgi:dienelactone hydrolase
MKNGGFDVERRFGLILRRLARQLSFSENAPSTPKWRGELLRCLRRYAPGGGQGPFPTAILLHGCAGDKAHLEGWGRLLARHGILAYTIDSLTPRKISAAQARCFVCTGLRLHGRERSRDVTEALSHILRDPMVDRRRISLVGWSHGAWTIMEWMLEDQAAAFAKQADLGIASLVLIYPYCGLASVIHEKDWTRLTPVMVVTGGKDFIVPTKKTLAFVENLSAMNAPVAHDHIEGAGHGFDVEGNSAYSAGQTRRLQKAILGFLTGVNG